MSVQCTIDNMFKLTHKRFEAGSDTSTWSVMVNTSAADHKRACVFCGEINMAPHRSLTVAEIEECLLNVPADSVCTTIANIVKSCELVWKSYGSSDTEPRAVTCMCCQHWIARRRKNTTPTPCILPLQAFRTYMRRMEQPGDNASSHKSSLLDARVVSRLVCTLTQDVGGGAWNYYLTLFTKDEQDLLYSLRTVDKKDMHAAIAQHYLKMNANTAFFVRSTPAELLRSRDKQHIQTDDAAGLRLLKPPGIDC